MPVLDLCWAKLLQQRSAKMRDDLLLGKLAISFDRFARQTFSAGKPVPQVFRQCHLRRFHGGAVVDLGKQSNQFGLRSLLRPSHCHKPCATLSRVRVAIARFELEPPTTLAATRDVSGDAHCFVSFPFSDKPSRATAEGRDADGCASA